MTTLPNFLFLISHLVMIFTDIYILKYHLSDEIKIGGYGLGLTIVHTFLLAIETAVANGLFT